MNPPIIYYRSVEPMFHNIDSYERGKELVERDIIRLGHYTGFPLRYFDNWEIDPFHDRNWQFWLNNLTFLSYIISYHYRSRLNPSMADKALKIAFRAVQSWHKIYGDRKSLKKLFEFSWHDHGTALRAQFVFQFLIYMAVDCLEEVNKYKLEIGFAFDILKESCLLLAKDRFYNKYTNHGIDQSKALYIVSEYMPELLNLLYPGKVSSEHDHSQWKEMSHTALSRLKLEFAFCFAPDGGHIENSPGYHTFAFDLLRSTCNILSDNDKESLGYFYGERANTILEFLARIIRPDGKLPILGDTQSTAVVKYDDLSSLPIYPMFLWTAFGKGRPLNWPLNKVFPDSGYAVFRNSWEWGRALQVIFRGGVHSLFHMQEDEGTILVYGYGEDWIIDSGMYNYNESEPIRQYMRCLWAHNVPYISHTQYPNAFVNRIHDWKTISYSEQENKASIEYQFTRWIPVIWSRRVIFENDSIEIVDSFNAQDEIERDIILQWHIPADKTLVKNNESISIVGSHGTSLHIRHSITQFVGMTIHKGKDDVKIYSLVSWINSEYENSIVLYYQYRLKNYLKITTSFNFSHVE